MAGDLRGAARRALTTVAVVLGVTTSAVVTGWLVGRVAMSVAGDRNAPWIVGRAAGISAYLLLTLLVATGLVLSHPQRSRLRRPSSATRIRVHVSIAVFTLALLVLHVVVLATDSYAGVGWWGSLVPMGSRYRPVPITLGVLGLYAGLLSGLTAALSGRRLVARVWWPLHKVASLAFLLVWAHGVFAGIDTPQLVVLYAGTGLGLLALAAWRYVARTADDLLDELEVAHREALRHGLHAVPARDKAERR